jgi:hypothetical protein
VARAKRTDRAEARRRYRAEMAGTEGFDEEGTPLSDGQASAPSSGRSAPSKGVMSSPPGRLGIGAAFRQSIHPINIRGDLMALPTLVTHKALLLPAALTVGATILVLATGSTNFVTALLYTYFVQSPAIGGVFLAGFLAPRASWLLGVIVGLISAVCYTAIILSGVLGSPGDAATRDIIVAAFLLSPVMGGLFAAGAAWYRRFLQLSNPNRGKQAPAKKTGNDGRSRSGAAKTR